MEIKKYSKKRKKSNILFKSNKKKNRTNIKIVGVLSIQHNGEKSLTFKKNEIMWKSSDLKYYIIIFMPL